MNRLGMIQTFSAPDTCSPKLFFVKILLKGLFSVLLNERFKQNP